MNQWGESIDHVRTWGGLTSFVQSHTSLLTEQNDLAVFDYSTRKTRADTCNVKLIG